MILGPRDGLIFNLIKVVGHVPIPEATDLFPERGGIIVHNYRNPPLHRHIFIAIYYLLPVSIITAPSRPFKQQSQGKLKENSLSETASWVNHRPKLPMLSYT